MSRSRGKAWLGVLLVTGVVALGVSGAQGRTPRPRVARAAGDLAVTESGLVRGVRSGDNGSNRSHISSVKTLRSVMTDTLTPRSHRIRQTRPSP